MTLTSARAVAEVAGPGAVGMRRSPAGDELARLLVHEALGWSGAAGSVVGLCQAGGALEIVGAAGLAVSWASQLPQLPAGADCLLTRVLRDGEPAWSDQAGTPAVPSADSLPHADALLSAELAACLRVAVPLHHGQDLLGVLEIAWAAGSALTAGQRRDIAALTQRVGPVLIRTLPPGTAGTAGRQQQRQRAGTAGRAPAWLREVVEAVPEPMAALAPFRLDDGQVADFTFACANRAAIELLGPGADDGSGARLLDAVPWAAASGAFAFIRQAFVTGVPYRDDAHGYVHDCGGVRYRATIGLTAGRIAGDTLLLGLRPAGDRAGRPAGGAAAPDAGVIQRLSRVGWWEWDVAAGLVRWTPDALTILGARASSALIPAAVPPFAPHPDDAAAVDRAMTALGRDGRACEVDFRIALPGGAVRHVRLAGEPLPGLDGAPALVAGVVQDVTDLRRTEVALEVAQVQVAAQRSRVEAERQLASLLQQIIMPVESVRMPADSGVEIAARYRPASAAAGIGGDWYGVFPLPGSAVLLTIGDVAGHGLSAASAMAQLHHALHGLAHIGAGPAELLGYLNVMACALPSATLASACCVLYDPAARTLRVANAGHPSPVLVAGGAAESLAAPGETMLGADPESSYSEAVLQVGAGDVLLLYTDGLVERRRGSGDDAASLLVAAAGRSDDLESYVDRVLSGARSDTDDDTCLIAVRFA